MLQSNTFYKQALHSLFPPKSLLIPVYLLFSGIHSFAFAITFTPHPLHLDFDVTHPVMPLKNQQEQRLAVIGEDTDKSRRLSVFRFDQSRQAYIAEHTMPLPKHYLGYSPITIANHSHILFLTKDALTLYNPIKKQMKHLSKAKPIYQKDETRFLSKKKMVRDVNGDGLDDIVLQGFRNIQIFLQSQSGTFTSHTLPIPSKVRLEQNASLFTERRLYVSDFNQDTRSDIATWTNDGFFVYLQSPQGTFQSAPYVMSMPDTLSSEYWWEIQAADGTQLDQQDLAHRTLEKIDDLNGDGLPDLIVLLNQSSGVFDRQDEYEIYLGSLHAEKQLIYSAKPSSRISLGESIADMELIDIDGDQRSEVVITSFNIGVSQIIRALTSGSIKQKVSIFSLTKEDQYPKEAQTTRTVRLRFNLSSGQSGSPVVELKDITGDGIKDIILSSGKSTLKVFEGSRSQSLFASKPTRHQFTLPKDGQYVQFDDLNGDGVHDLIIRYGRQDEAKHRNTVNIFFANS